MLDVGRIQLGTRAGRHDVMVDMNAVNFLKCLQVLHDVIFYKIKILRQKITDLPPWQTDSNHQAGGSSCDFRHQSNI